MDAVSVAHAYFDAWNRHDPAGIVAAFHDGGSYSDPATGGALAGQAISQYAGGLFAAFPDLSFEVITFARAGDDVVAAEWIMPGVNTGPLFDGPPTDKRVELGGADFVKVEGDKIRSVNGYFDQKDFVQQLGLQAIIQPHSIGPIAFGTCVYMSGGNDRKPGAFSITRIATRSEMENADVEQLSTAILEDLAGTPGFISTVLTTVGLAGHTITAWDDAEAPKQLFKGGSHKNAMARFFGPGFASGGMTSVWVPARINTSWIRCGSCGRMMNHDQLAVQGERRCGAPLPERLPYW